MTYYKWLSGNIAKRGSNRRHLERGARQKLGLYFIEFINLRLS